MHRPKGHTTPSPITANTNNRFDTRHEDTIHSNHRERHAHTIRNSGSTGSVYVFRSNDSVLGASFLSSSSDSSASSLSRPSSRDGLPTMQMPSSSSGASGNRTGSISTRSTTAALEKSHNAMSRSGVPPIQTTASIVIGPRVRRSRISSRLRSSELPTDTNNLNGVVACSGPVRYALPISSKPATTRSSSGRCRSTRSTSSSNSQSLSRNSNFNDSVQITGMERPSNGIPSRYRVGRTAMQPQRSNRPGVLNRRTLTASGRNTASITTQHASSANSQSSFNRAVRRTRNISSVPDLRAALAVARRPPNPSTDGDDDCVICLCEKSNRSVVLPCMHTFCFDCIYRWLIINPSCPLCKRVAERVIHSVLSDTDFIEVIVSDLHAQRNDRRLGGVPLSYEVVDRISVASSDDTGRHASAQFPQRQSHHHYHYHLNSPPVPLLDSWNEVSRNRSTGPPSMFSSIEMIPFRSLLRPIMSASGLDVDPARTAFRWNPEFGSPAEGSRLLLNNLVNNALRRRNSFVSDGLLLRQLVYIFRFDSIPFAQEPALERDISPNFLATNETQRQRLQGFIRRELRVVAPWLAFRSTTERPNSDSDETQAGSAVTAPLLCGAPGLLTETPELDTITEQVVNHFTSVPMTDANALQQLLVSFPSLRPPLVPTTYLEHFCSEVIQFARYSGTLEQYDSAVCLYQRRHNPTNDVNDLNGWHSSSRTPLRDPRLAVYMGSACWPRLRPGFVEPQGLITHPLINWMLQRLFVHSVSGLTHPACLPGTGEYPSTIPDPLVFQYSRTPCHPHCSRLASLSRALLEAVPNIMWFRSSAQLEYQSHSNGRETGTGTNVGRTGGRMTSTELFPNRLVYQRILSELLDQARFSDALATYFNAYHREAIGPLDSDMPSRTDAPHSRPTNRMNLVFHLFGDLISELSTETGDSPSPSLPSLSGMDCLRPALETHGQALRRLSGLLLLFTARVPSGIRAESDEDVISELIHTPLMPMTVSRTPRTSTSNTVIDLTANTTTRDELSSNVSSVASPIPSSHSDWNFLLPPIPSSVYASSRSSVSVHPEGQVRSNRCEPHDSVSLNRDEPSVVDEQFSSPTQHQPVTLDEHTADVNHVNLSGTRNTQPSRLTGNLSPSVTETYWRLPTDSCVIISSDSSSTSEVEFDDNVTIGRSQQVSRSMTNNIQAGDNQRAWNLVLRETKPEYTNLSDPALLTPAGCSDLLVVEDDTLRLSLDSHQPGTPPVSLSRASIPAQQPTTDLRHMEEPMDVDEKPEPDSVQEGSSEIQTIVPGNKRPSSSSSTRPKRSSLVDLPLTTKLPRLSDRSPTHSTSRLHLSLYKPHHRLRTVYSSPSRHHKFRRGTRSRSPVVLVSSDSDCEVLHESIRVYSVSSSSASSCSSSSCSPSSSSSSSPSRERSRSPSISNYTERRLKRISRDSSRLVYRRHRHHRHHRHCHHHRHHCHSCRRRRKAGRVSKHARHDSYKLTHRIERSGKSPDTRTGAFSSHSRYYPRLRMVRLPAQTVQLPSVSSPIVISDDDSDHSLESGRREHHTVFPDKNTCVDPLSTVCSTTDEQELGQHAIGEHPTEQTSCHSSLSLKPCCSYSDTTQQGTSVKFSEPVPVPNSSSCEVGPEADGIETNASPSCIFEPSNLSEFYEFLAGLQTDSVQSALVGDDQHD